MAGGREMKENLISRQIEEYIAYKKGLGYQIKIESQELRRFAKYTIDIGYKGSLTIDVAFRWATLDPGYSRWYMARRMETVKTFSAYACVFDSQAQMIPKGMFGKCHGRTVPYIYSEQEIRILMKAAENLYSPDKLRGRVIPVGIGLLWSTGMRPNEACDLMNDDVDLKRGSITIRETKFRKSRILPIHETTVAQLKSYVQFRDETRKDFSEPYFLITTGGQRLALQNFQYAMKRLRYSLLQENQSWTRRPPRLYDFRHSFACRTILGWLKEGVDVDSKMIYLSTYLGHVKIADTYWYLTGIPEIMEVVSENFEKLFGMNGDVCDED